MQYTAGIFLLKIRQEKHAFTIEKTGLARQYSR